MIDAFTFKLQEIDKVAQITETINFYLLSNYVSHFSNLYFCVDRESLQKFGCYGGCSLTAKKKVIFRGSIQGADNIKRYLQQRFTSSG